MVINTINANFKLFTDFAATAAKQTTRAALCALYTVDGEARTVQASSRHDFVGNVGRLSATKTDNNAVRDLFRKTIADIFGGEDKIPESVKAAMKLEDYGKGKPLTARRITIVKAAVEQAIPSAKRYGDQAIDALVNANIDKRSDMDEERFAALSKTVRDAIASCGDDVDAMDTIASSIFDICIAGNNDVRSEEAILEKVDAIKSNFRELREVTKGNRVAFDIGRDAIKNLKGKSMPEGAFRAMVEAAKQVDVSTIGRLKASTGPVTINRAMLQFFRNYDEIVRNTGLLATLKQDVAMFVGARNFSGALMLGRFSRSKLREIQAALSSENAAELSELFRAGTRDWFRRVPIDDKTINEAIMGNPDEEVPDPIADMIRHSMERVSTAGFGAFHNIIGLILGEEPKEVPDLDNTRIPVNSKMILEDYGKEARIQLGMAE